MRKEIIIAASLLITFICEVNQRDDGKCFCDRCYEAHTCPCGCQTEVKDEGDICWELSHSLFLN